MSTLTLPDNLLPCPFCGGPATSQPWHGGEPTKVLISCDDGGDVDCPVNPLVSGETPEEAAAKWNTRLDPEAATDAIRYRYLRDYCATGWQSRIGGPDTITIDFEGKGHDVDAAIDAEIEGAE
jgi:hypothetical protein